MLCTVFQKNIDLLNIIETIVSHYTAERSRNWDLRTAALKESIHFAMISNCTQYGPLLVELLFHQFSFQERYLDLMREGFFTHKLRNTDKSAFVGNDAVIEDVNLLAGQFRHKRQTLEQAIDQSNSIDVLQKQQQLFDKNLNIQASECDQIFKDDRETKIRLVRALLHFNSFNNKNRLLHNEFSTENCILNPEILKPNWYPAADYLIRRFVKQNISHPFCNLPINDSPPLLLSEVSQKLLKRITKSRSIVMGIKTKPCQETTTESNEIKIKRKAKEIMNQLIWEGSHFENAAAICNHDSSKLTTNKSKIREAIKFIFGYIPKAVNSDEDEKFTIGEKDWFTDFTLHTFINAMISHNRDLFSVMYPLTVDVLTEIINSKSRIFNKVGSEAHNCIVPLNTGSHWVTLFFLGLEKRIYYLDSFGNPPNDRLLNIVNKRFLFWPTQHNDIKLQHDSYQCGVWCSLFVAICVEYLNLTKDENKNSAKNDFMNFLIQRLVNKKIISFSNNITLVSNDFPKNLRKTCTASIQKNMLESSLQNETPIPETINDNQFFYETFPSHIKFNVVSVDCQHTLWNVPTAKNGKEYIEFLEKRFMNKYLTNYADTLYWNYDLGETVKKTIPKSAVQETRDTMKKDKMDYLQSRLLGEENIISDDYITDDWNAIICDRANRNKVAKYVGANCHLMHIPPGKLLVTNSEAVMNGERSVPMIYKNKNNFVEKVNALDMENTYCEGEGAAVAFIKRNHLKENVIVVSNDTDSLFYCLIAANKRDRVQNKFLNQFWLEINYTSKLTGLSGCKNKRISEYWDINELIYCIEARLPNLKNAALSLVVLYLSAGSDLTEKWYGKTHSLFLKKFLTHSEFIGDLVNINPFQLNANAYRKLVHCVWLGENSDPSKITFDELRRQTQKRKNIRSRLPDEKTILQHFRRVSGAYKYMLSYASDKMEKIDWLNYGFEYDDGTKSYYPVIQCDEIPLRTRPLPPKNDPPQKCSKLNPKSQEQIDILEKEFLNCNYLSDKSLDNLINVTGLKRAQIQDWFSRKRRKSSSNKENV